MQTSSVNVASLTGPELAAWRGLLQAHRSLVHEYEVLLLLSEAPGQRMRMSDVAASVLLSQSGLTRLVDRLARAGSVERTRCLEDRRGLHAELTEAGRARLGQARPTHLHGVRTRFLDHFTPAELETLGGFWERVAPGATAQ